MRDGQAGYALCAHDGALRAHESMTTARRPLDPDSRAYKRAIWAIAGGILVFAVLQCLWALSLGSRQLLKDGLDWAYDVVLYGIAAFVFGRSVWAERVSALLIAVILGI